MYVGTDAGLDELLARSAPASTPITAAVKSELVNLRAATGPIREERSRRWRRQIAIGLAGALLFGGAAAAAASGAWSLPWAESDSLVSFTYTLPSGVECEQRVGGVTGTVPRVTEATESFYRNTDIQALLTPEAIRAAIERERSGDVIHVLDDGTQVPGGYGTAYYDADREYMTAVWDVVVTAMDDELAREGLAGVDNTASLQSEPNCPGLDLTGPRP